MPKGYNKIKDEKIGVFKRLNLDKEKYLEYGQRYQEDLVKKKLANELKPEEIKDSIYQVDKAYAALMNAN